MERRRREQIAHNLRRGFALWQLARREFLHGEHYNPDEMIVPELYLQGAGEAFTLTILVSWAVTLAYNPAIVERNLLKDLVGYNNVCVGFDAAPARYVAVPLFALVSFLAVRYVNLDSLRAQLQDAVRPIECHYLERAWWYVFSCDVPCHDVGEC